jgi:leader peptidase (prepilin peptidase)/N-methyltransferase
LAVAAAALGAACYVTTGAGAPGVLAGGVAVVLVWLAGLDLEYRLLPNRIVLPAVLTTLAAQSALAPGRSVELVAAALGAATFFLVFAVARPGALGMGDVKLALLLGTALGQGVVPALAIGCGAIAIAAGGLAVVHGRKALRMTIPLGPFLAFGALVVLLGGSL